ncbi:hypothetical protein [Dyella japonica]|uniref:hypothetical protein n=1 Tax=Dyella japonica TaxID=231455 RepID=UPI001184A719|nr:hypothetical protein [Dyella japonica]
MKNHIKRAHQNEHQQRKQTESQRREQAEKKWSKFLNESLGFLGFPLGLACLTTKTPSINATLCLAFILAVWFSGIDLMPKHFRERAPTGPSEPQGQRISFRSRHQFWLQTLPAILGYAYLIVIALSYGIERHCNIPAEPCATVRAMLQAYVGAPGL